MLGNSRNGGGIAGWSIRHPIGVVMTTLALVVLGFFATGRLGLDLLPQITYPEIGVRINDPGVPATIMEDAVTRQLEEQLAITEDAILVQSRTREGRTSVDIGFRYGTDMDVALRDASSRLDRAKRFLPDSIDPPIVFKRDPSQLPVAEYVLSSSDLDSMALRDWADYRLSKWLLNSPGVASVEVGGGARREIQVITDQDRLALLGMDVLELEERMQSANLDTGAGSLRLPGLEISGRTSGRWLQLQDIRSMPLSPAGTDGLIEGPALAEAAQVLDTFAEGELRVRADGETGIKLSIQKQPQANTIEVVDELNGEIGRLQASGLIPAEMTLTALNDEAVFIRHSLRNAGLAAVSGALLAMLVVFLFLGSLRRTLIIGSAIPVAVLATLSLMALGDLTLNTMSLGGLALGVGMLVDNAIVMLENIARHQRAGESPRTAALHGASEVQSAVIASTTTNLAAVLPFLFIGGLIGLLFRELIITISAAILASLLVALTLVPALAGGAGVFHPSGLHRLLERAMALMQEGLQWLLRRVLRFGWLLAMALLAALSATAPQLLRDLDEFLPTPDDGRVTINLTADQGTSLDRMDRITIDLEDQLAGDPRVAHLFATVGGNIFGRSTFSAPNRARIELQLSALADGRFDTPAWIRQFQQQIRDIPLVGVRIQPRQRGIRGLRLGQGEDDLAFRVLGPDLARLEQIADQMLDRLKGLPGLINLAHSNEERHQEIEVRPNPARAARWGLDAEDIGRAVRFALDGRVITEYLSDDRRVDIRLRLDRAAVAAPAEIERILLFSRIGPRVPVRLGEVASVGLISTPDTILRERQQRIVEVTASLSGDTSLLEALSGAKAALADIETPGGYRIYEAGNQEALKQGRSLGGALLGLAVFLVLVVMAVQYESLRNPVIIILSLPFTLIGVWLGLHLSGIPLSMPVWLGMIMLAGIVVNNAIVLVEYIELERRRGLPRHEAILSAAGKRLRPILMTSLTTVFGMLPLAIGMGEGTEMLRPLAIALISGLGFSILVSLLLVPVLYHYLASPDAVEQQSGIAVTG